MLCIFVKNSQDIGSMRACKVFVNGQFAGVLAEESPTRYTFSYDAEYLHQVRPAPVCIAMPPTAEPYVSDCLFPFFSNLLSEGANRDFQTRLHHLLPDDDFGLLLKTATYDTIGSVTVKEIEA